MRRLLFPALLITLAAVAVGIGISERTDIPSDIPAPEVVPPAPPEFEPSRKQEGGLAERREYERLRLADPATGIIPPDIHAREAAFSAGLPTRDRYVFFEEPETAAQLAREGRVPEKGMDWEYRGPYNVGGRTRALAIDVSDPTYTTLLAGGISGGMWRSANDGASWTMTTGSTQLHSVTCIAQDTRPGHTDTWYYGTGEVRGNSASLAGGAYSGDGVFKSTDGGLSWNLLPSTSTNTPQTLDQQWDYVWRVVVDASETVNDEVYAAIYGGIFRSLDGGATWTRVLGDPEFWSTYTDVVISSDGVLYASLSSTGGVPGIFRSTDGVDWTEITPAGLNMYQRIVLGIAPSNENIVYALVASVNGGVSEGFYKYTYLSGDGSGAGGSWENRSSTIQSLPGPSGSIVALETYSSYCQTVTVAPDNPNLVFLGGIHLYRSYDGFATTGMVSWVGGWQYPVHHADQHWMLYRPGSTTIAYTGSDGGVHKTTNVHAPTVAWSSLNNGYNTSQFYTVAIEQNLVGSDIVVGGMQDNGSWWTNQVSGTTNWVEALGGDGAYCAVADLSGVIDRYFFSYQNGAVYYMGLNDAGAYQEWTRVDPTGAGSYLFINPFILDPYNPDMMYVATSNGVWRNSDLTAFPLWSNSTTTLNWTQLTSTPGNTAISALAGTRAGTRRLYYGTVNGRLFRVDNAHNAPGGTVPTELPTDPNMPSGYVASIAVDPWDDDHLLVAFSNYQVRSLWTSYDGGFTWHDVEGNLAGSDGPSVRAVAILPYGEHEFWFAGTSTGLYSAVDPYPGPAVWSRESPELIGNVVVDALTSRWAESLVVAASHGKGVYSAKISGPAAAPDMPAAVGALAQNAPNPFNPTTSIRFRLPNAGRATLDVYDVHGRHVVRLLDAERSADWQTVAWSGVDARGEKVSSGTYLYRVRSGDWSAEKKMTLIK